MLSELKRTSDRWLALLFGGAGVCCLLLVGGYAGVFSVTILLDVLVRTAGLQMSGLIIGALLLAVAAAGMGLGGKLLSPLWNRMRTSPRPTAPELSGSTSLHQLREGYQVDYDLRTWTVTEHAQHPYEGWPTDTWLLERDDDERVLEHDREEGSTFRLYERVPVSEVRVMGAPFSEAVEDETAPTKLTCTETEHTRYVLVEEDARAHDEALVRSGEEPRISFLVRSRSNRSVQGVLGGLATYLNVSPWAVRLGYLFILLAGPSAVAAAGRAPSAFWWTFALLGAAYVLLWGVMPGPPPEQLAHYWLYESNDGGLVALQCDGGTWPMGAKTWTAYVGRTVAPYEFDNVLPPAKS